MKHSSMNLNVQIYVFDNLVYISKNRITGSYGNFIFNLISYYQTFTTICEGSSSHFPQILGKCLFLFFLIIAILARYDLDLYFINDLMIFNIHRLAICISTLKTYLFKFFAYILTELFAFLLLCYKNIFIYPDTIAFSNIYFANVLPHSMSHLIKPK